MSVVVVKVIALLAVVVAVLAGAPVKSISIYTVQYH